jgi:hypothetical protein
MPSYNHAPFLGAAIDSVLAQTHRDLELVIVDDGSTDGSLEIAREYARRDSQRVRVFTHPGHANRGYPETANLAFEQSRGEFWIEFASDDVMRPHRLSRQLGYLRRHPDVDVVYSYSRLVDRDGRPLPRSGLGGVDVTRERDPLQLLVPGSLVPANTMLARRACRERTGGHDPHLVYSDWELWVRVFSCSRVGFLTAVVADSRLHGDNLSRTADSSVHRRRFLEVVEALKAKVPALAALQDPRILALLDLEHAYLRFCEGALSDAAGLLVSAFAHDPSLRRSPAPLGYFLARWECDFFHPRLHAEDYARLGVQLRVMDPADLPTLGAALSPGNFSQWFLSVLPETVPEQTRGELLRLVAAVQFVAAAQRHREARARTQALAAFAQAFRTYPRLLAGRTPGSLFSHTVQPATVAALDRLRPGQRTGV